MDFKNPLKKIKRFPVAEAVLFALVLALDLVGKALAAAADGGRGADTDVLGKFLRFVYYRNGGAAFSFLGDAAWAPVFFIVLSFIALPAIGFFLYTQRRRGLFCRLSIALILTGAAGNLIDRLSTLSAPNGPYVRDFISFSFFPAVFNVADAALTSGVVMFLFWYVFLNKDKGGDKGAENRGGEGTANRDEK